MPDLFELEVGSSGLNQWDGTVHDEKLRQLSSPERRNRTYREMADNDPVVGAVLFVVDMLIRQIDWRVTPFMDEGSEQALPEDEQVASFVQSCMNDMARSFKEIVSEALSFLTYGWSYHEIVFKRRTGEQPGARLFVGDDGQVTFDPGDRDAQPSSRFDDGLIGWHKISGRAQETLVRWVFDSHGEVAGMVQSAPPNYREVFIPSAKALHFRTSALRNNPEGRSVLRNAYRPWYFKKVIEEIQAVGIERDLAGFPVLWVPEDVMKASSSQNPALSALRTELEQLVRNVRRGQQEGALAPRRINKDGTLQDVYKLELLSTNGRRQFDIKATLEYYDQRIAMMALADFVLLGHEKVGSFALADSKTNIFTMAVGAWIDVLADQFNDRAIPQLLRLNGLDANRAPELVHTDIETVDLGALGSYLSDLAAAGMVLFPDPELEEHLMAEAKLPYNSGDEI